MQKRLKIENESAELVEPQHSYSVQLEHPHLCLYLEIQWLLCQ
jgi:hypothetical protein